jgi:hypothetical protein
MGDKSVNLGAVIPMLLIEKGDIVARSSNDEKLKVIRVEKDDFVCLPIGNSAYKKAERIPKGSYLIKY